MPNQHMSCGWTYCTDWEVEGIKPAGLMLLNYHVINTLRPRPNGRHFADDIFKCIFFNENVLIPIKISLKFVPKDRINNISSLVQLMAWRRPGDKPLSEPLMFSSLTHICVTRLQWVNATVSVQYVITYEADHFWRTKYKFILLYLSRSMIVHLWKLVQSHLFPTYVSIVYNASIINCSWKIHYWLLFLCNITLAIIPAMPVLENFLFQKGY